MKNKTLSFLLIGLFLSACAGGPVGNKNVPQPVKAVEIEKYLGKWYEIARYENRFEKDCEAVTAEYNKLPDGKVGIKNSCSKNGNSMLETTGFWIVPMITAGQLLESRQADIYGF